MNHMPLLNLYIDDFPTPFGLSPRPGIQIYSSFQVTKSAPPLTLPASGPGTESSLSHCCPFLPNVSILLYRTDTCGHILSVAQLSTNSNIRTFFNFPHFIVWETEAQKGLKELPEGQAAGKG